MWLLTPLGSFLAVQPPGRSVLSIRAHQAMDLDALRAAALPSLGPTEAPSAAGGLFAAICTHEAWAVALGRLALGIDAADLVARVEATRGPARARVMQRVEETLADLAELSSVNQPMNNERRDSYGAVVVDPGGRILLHKPSTPFEQDAWTFPKGRAAAGESGEEAAAREVREETGWEIELLDPVPGTFEGTTGRSHYWRARPRAQVGDFDWESDAIGWFLPEEARALLGQAPHPIKRQRDLAVLQAALSMLPPPSAGLRAAPPGWPRASASLFYEDAPAAIAFLEEAFGFQTRLRVEGEGGAIEHSELCFGDAVVMVGSAGRLPWAGSPRRVGACTQALFLYVDDADAHCARARAAGARIVREPETMDYGPEHWVDRTYECVDLEGHHWWFAHRVSTAPPGG